MWYAPIATQNAPTNDEYRGWRMKRSDWYQQRAKNSGSTRQWYRIQNKTDDASTAQIDIYDEIDWLWGVSAADFRNDLKALPDTVNTIDLHINSPGGDVYEAIAIMNSLRQHDARVVTTVDGLAASSAGFIAVGASDELIMADNSEIMAHLPWALVIGDSGDMRRMADDLDRIGKNIASIFADRTNSSVDDWIQVLVDETWWSAQEAVDAGIADKVLKAPKRDGAKNHFDLSVFNHAGRAAAPAPRIPVAHKTPQPVEVEVNKGKEPTVASLNESALQKLGLDAEADEDAVNAAIEALAEKAAEKADEAPPAPAEPTIDEATKVAAKFGMTVVNATKYEQMEATVAELSAARENALMAADEVTIKNALDTGRIDPATANDWRAELAKNREGITALIAKLPANKAVPVDELGHGVSREEQPEDSDKAQVFAQLTGFNYGKEA